MMPGNALSAQKASALARIGNGSSWFLWIAGMSLVNAVIAMTGAQWHFILGLGLTELIDDMPTTAVGHAIAFGFDLIVAAVWVLFNMQAKQGRKWAFIVGITLYVVDALLLLVFQSWLSVAFHVYALFRIFPGLQAISELRRIEQAERQQAAMASAQFGYSPAPAGVWPPPPVAETAPPAAWPAPAANTAQPAWPPPASDAAQPPAWQPSAGEPEQPGVYPPNR
ncbi:hypothetical protein CCAX7_16460 [Capsulimonas corticalis]|uniref:Uncharacterized protein n=1 Tax=Capsulimonas corticalis TaxID=2219043 RepID=A0A402CYX7_9BACT|nr:hypothetical protein [Capsulimonas corticalis]BDI29595.1 hypothetical protein CCAX7_16460 [Capsulimonas corticalis]